MREPAMCRCAVQAIMFDDIKRIDRDTNGRYGSPRVHAELRAQGRGASRGRIERLMRRHGIRAIMARPRRVRTTDSHHDLPIAPNLLERNFISAAWRRTASGSPTSPTSRLIRAGFIWPTVDLDLDSRKIVGWAMADHCAPSCHWQPVAMAHCDTAA